MKKHICFALLRSEIPSGICAKLRTVAASNNRVHMPLSLYYCLFAPHICMVSFFTHIPFLVNHTINATPPERLQQHHAGVPKITSQVNNCNCRTRIDSIYREQNKHRWSYHTTVLGNGVPSHLAQTIGIAEKLWHSYLTSLTKRTKLRSITSYVKSFSKIECKLL